MSGSNICTNKFSITSSRSCTTRTTFRCCFATSCSFSFTIPAGTAVAVGMHRGFVTGSRSSTARTGLGRGLSRTSPGIGCRVATRTRVRMGMPFTTQSCSAATVGTRFRPIGATGLVCRRSTRLAGRALATGIGRRTTVIAGFVGYVAVGIARTRSTDTAGIG